MSISWANLGMSLVFAVVIPEIFMYYLNRYRQHSKSKSEHLNEVMFFTDKGFQCKSHCYNRFICTKDSCSYRHLRYTYQITWLSVPLPFPTCLFLLFLLRSFTVCVIRVNTRVKAFIYTSAFEFTIKFCNITEVMKLI